MLANIGENNRSVTEVLTPARLQAFATLGPGYWRITLTPLARFAVSRGIEPGDVNDTIMDTYFIHLRSIALVAKPETTHQNVCRIWNKVACTFPSWPQTLLTVPNRSRQWRLDVTEFEPSFIKEVEAYLASLNQDSGNDWSFLLDPDAPPKALRPTSIKTKRDQILQFSSALVHMGVPVREITGLAALVTLEHFRLGLRYILDRPREDPQNTKTAAMVAHTIRCVAKHYLKIDPKVLYGLDRITNNLTPTPGGMTEKNRHRLAQFDDARLLGRFLRLPREGLAKLRAKAKLRRNDAVTASLLLALEILIHAPMREANLASLNVGINLRLPDQVGDSVILLNPEKVKNGASLTYYLPPEITALVRWYVTDVTKLLEPARTGFLFPGTMGRSKRPDTISKQLSRFVKDRLGIDFSPHLIRHLSAKLILDAYPGEYELPRRLLGHTNTTTTYRSYSGMETRSAAKAHQEIIRDKREAGIDRPPSGGPRPRSCSSKKAA